MLALFLLVAAVLNGASALDATDPRRALLHGVAAVLCLVAATMSACRRRP
jgi:hypothetical protein